MTRKGTIGILGGMGPMATLELFKRIVALTPASKDQEHLRIVIDNNPGIPDRTAAILGKGESPLPAMIEGARTLERAGANVLVIPCNTAHHWLFPLREGVSIPIIDMVGEAAATVAAARPPLATIGLLATAGSVKAGLYHRALGERGLASLLPTAEEQNRLMETIHQIKAGNYRVKEQVLNVAQSLLKRGAQGMILGCTELSLVVEEGDLPCPLFDPLAVLARRVVEWARQGE